jgi:choline kinase
MKGVILAAGEGKRLAPMGWTRPKCLLEFGGQTLLDNIVKSLLEQSIDKITIVLGYQKQTVEKVMLKYPLKWDIVVNEDYADTNTIYSLWLARDFLNEDFIYFNADVLFDRRIVSLLLGSGHPDLSGLAVDVKQCGQEEVKVVTDDSYRITAIGKKLAPQDCYGEFVGIAKFSKTACRSLVSSLDNYNRQPKQRQLFFESAVNNILKAHTFIAVPIGDLVAIEIDSPQDYQRANQLWAQKLR